jgi:hypothetical protein
MSFQVSIENKRQGTRQRASSSDIKKSTAAGKRIMMRRFRFEAGQTPGTPLELIAVAVLFSDVHTRRKRKRDARDAQTESGILDTASYSRKKLVSETNFNKDIKRSNNAIIRPFSANLASFRL